MEEQQIIPDDDLVLARQLGLYDEWEARLESYLFENNPDDFWDKEYIILLASSAREVAHNSKHPLQQDDAHNRLMSGVSRTLYETLVDSISVMAGDIEAALHPIRYRQLMVYLSHNERIIKAVEEAGGLELMDYDPDVNDEIFERLLPDLVREIIAEKGGLDVLLPEITDDEKSGYDRFYDLLKVDYRKAFNLGLSIGITYPKPRYLSSLTDQCKERGEEEPPYFHFRNQQGHYEEVPVLPDWAVDRYFQGNSEMKDAFHKYRNEIEEYYQPIFKEQLDDLVNRGVIERQKSMGFELFDEEYYFVFDIPNDGDDD